MADDQKNEYGQAGRSSGDARGYRGYKGNRDRTGGSGRSGQHREYRGERSRDRRDSGRSGSRDDRRGNRGASFGSDRRDGGFDRDRRDGGFKGERRGGRGGFDRSGQRRDFKGDRNGNRGVRSQQDRQRKPAAKRQPLPEGFFEFFATCPFGFEEVLAEELRGLRLYRVRPLNGGVSFQGKPQGAYKACLWSRCASRIMLVIDRVDAADADELYESVKAIAWEDHMVPEKTMAVFARGTSDTLRNSTFTGQKVKDAVCDRLRETCGSRPDVDAENPDVSIWVNLHGARATINIDFAGGSLHRRGYREDGVQAAAPLKEALAVGILMKAGWATRCTEVATFVDPMCGSGTFVIEAAMMAADRAPGLLREKWGFQGWKNYVADEFDELLDEADERFEAGLAKELPLFVGADLDESCMQIAHDASVRAGVSSLVRFAQADCANLTDTLEAVGADLEKPGFVAVNPPYGIRLAKGQLREVTDHLRQGVSALPENWCMVVITPDETFDAALAMDATEAITVYNGRIESKVRFYELGSSRLEGIQVIDLDGNECTVPVSSGHAEQFAARLRKVAKQRRKWAQREGIHAYRVYDADLPDYAVAIEVVWGMRIQDPVEEQREFDARRNHVALRREGRRSDFERSEGRARDDRRGAYRGRDDHRGRGRFDEAEKPKRAFVHAKTVSPEVVAKHAKAHLVISEYQAPREIDPTKAARRLDDAVKLARTIFGVPEDRVALRVRKQDKGGSQYAQDEREGMYLLTVEGGHVFELNLTGYLDTGLFLDHRPVRGMIEQRAAGKRFLNLFAYTGTATVYAAAGGAASTATVDLSATYLEWARRNMQRNDFRDRKYRFSKADTMRWLDDAREAGELYDLVFVDPPTFSNSKAMGTRTWDIQRDHVALLNKVGRVLAPGGTILFSGNLRSFKLDTEGLTKLGLTWKDITAQTIPEDFERNKRIHFCFEITRA